MKQEAAGSPANMCLAAIERTGEADVDVLLNDVAQQLKQRGYRVGGAVRSNEPKPGDHPCDVVLRDLVSGETIPLAQNPSFESSGCQLDTAALEQVAGLVGSSLDRGVDILIVNKFGKREAEGAGLTGAIAQAVSAEIPVLVSVNKEQVAAWQSFCGGEGKVLSPDAASIMTWLSDKLPAASASS